MTNSGINAASGAVCMTMKIGDTSQSKRRSRPMARPMPIPRNAEINIPTTSGLRVSA